MLRAFGHWDAQVCTSGVPEKHRPLAVLFVCLAQQSCIKCLVAVSSEFQDELS